MGENNLAETIEKHKAFWTGTGGPLLALTSYAWLSAVELPLADGTLVKEDTHLTPDMLDSKLLVDIEELPDQPRLQPDRPGGISGDVLIVRPPITKMCWVEAVMGCPVTVRVDSGSIYSEPYLNGPQELERILSPHENGWLDFLVAYARTLVDEADGRYHVSLPLMRGTIDLVAALLGYEKMAYSFYDQPQELKKLIERCVEAYLSVAEGVYSVIPPVSGGRVSRFNVWAPGSVAITQCDASAGTSARLYEDFFFPYEEEICSHFDYSAVHLHSGFLHTIDTFLKTEYPTAIQVSFDTGSTRWTSHDLIPVFRKVLEKKPLYILGACTRSELDELLEALPHQGLCIGAYLTDAP